MSQIRHASAGADIACQEVSLNAP